MAFNKKTEQKHEYVLNDIQNVRQWKDGGITFTAIVNGVYCYGMRIVDQDKDWFVAFPSRKGSDGKYYKHCYFPIDDDMKELIGTCIEQALDTE